MFGISVDFAVEQAWPISKTEFSESIFNKIWSTGGATRSPWSSAAVTSDRRRRSSSPGHKLHRRRGVNRLDRDDNYRPAHRRRGPAPTAPVKELLKHYAINDDTVHNFYDWTADTPSCKSFLYPKWSDQTNDPNHGNACFESNGVKNGGVWECPAGCTKIHRAPYCAIIGHPSSPCRTPKSVPPMPHTPKVTTSSPPPRRRKGPVVGKDLKTLKHHETAAAYDRRRWGTSSNDARRRRRRRWYLL